MCLRITASTEPDANERINLSRDRDLFTDIYIGNEDQSTVAATTWRGRARVKTWPHWRQRAIVALA